MPLKHLVALALATILGACATPRARLFEGMGAHTRTVSTENALAQRYFDQGLILSYGFNHDEAVRSFDAAIELDPGCAMAHWGRAYALGPNINLPLPDAPAANGKLAHAAIQRQEVGPRPGATRLAT